MAYRVPLVSPIKQDCRKLGASIFINGFHKTIRHVAKVQFFVMRFLCNVLYFQQRFL